MKRGLVEAAQERRGFYEARIDRLRERLREAGVHVALIYGDVYRSDDIAHLTNLCIYWNEGVVAVPVDAPPAFLAKLSKRVHPWMRRTSILEDLRASQKLPQLLAGYLDELGSSRVGFIDRAWWPAELVDGVVAAAPGKDFIDLPDAVRDGRLVPDELDRQDLERAGAIVAGGLAAASAAEGEPETRIAALELAARGAGARDVLTVIHRSEAGEQPDCSVQFANVWARATRPNGGPSAAVEALETAATALRSAATLADIQAAAGAGTAISIVSHCDIATGGDLRLISGDPGPLAEGAVVVLEVRLGDAIAADTYVVHREHAAAITQAVAGVTV